MNRSNLRRPLAVIGAIALLAGMAACAPAQPETPAAQPTVSAAPLPRLDTAGGNYDLGPAKLVQAGLPAGNPRREMPVRLNGYIAAPTSAPPEGGFPVVVMLHGTHPGCPATGEVDTWPCDAKAEQANYAGLSWLADEVAAGGYVALSLNLNAEYTLGWGEGRPGDRLAQLVDRHLAALVTASSGGANKFGIDLAGVADPTQLALVGHSRAGEAAVQLARDWAQDGTGGGYGPASGLLLLAPAVVFVPTDGGLPAPTAIVLPACDADVVTQDGQGFYEAMRNLDNKSWVTSVWVEGANHNNVNTVLQPDSGLEGRPDCGTQLAPEDQREFTGEYATDFLTAVFSKQPARVQAAMSEMGINPGTPAPSELYGQPAQVTYLPPARDRYLLMTPTGPESLVAGEDGAPVTQTGLVSTYCPEGYFVPDANPDASPDSTAACRRALVTVPGYPAHIVATWDAPGALLQFGLPAAAGDVSGFDALSVRVAVDPLSPLNPADAPQAFTIRLTDTAGKSATVTLDGSQEALRFPAGQAEKSEYFPGDHFTGRVPLMPVRVPLAQFTGVDLGAISQVSLEFDQTASGTLFLADLEFLG